MKEIKEKIVGQRVLSAEATVPTEESKLNFAESALDTSYTKEVAEFLKEHVGKELPQQPVLRVVRPRRIGNTWRLKPPYAEHALYVTIEAITLSGKKYPYEVFFHGKDISHRQWTDTLTLSLSEIFRKSIDYGFSLNNQLHNMQDTTAPEGGYRTYLREGDEKPTYVKGLVSEVGYVLEAFVKECLAYNYSNSSHEVPPTIEEIETGKFIKDYEAVNEILSGLNTANNSIQELKEFAKDHMLSLKTFKPQEYMSHWKELAKPLPPTSSVVYETGRISTLGERHKRGKQIGSRCAKCGEYAVVNQSGCFVCNECGDTKCE